MEVTFVSVADGVEPVGGLDVGHGVGEEVGEARVAVVAGLVVGTGHDRSSR